MISHDLHYQRQYAPKYHLLEITRIESAAALHFCLWGSQVDLFGYYEKEVLDLKGCWPDSAGPHLSGVIFWELQADGGGEQHTVSL